jgi:hypothetical protein
VCLSSQATLQAEIRRITVSGQYLTKKKKKIVSLPISRGKKLGIVVSACFPSDFGKHKISRLAWAKSNIPSPKYPE